MVLTALSFLSALLAVLLRGQIAQTTRRPTLFAIDELPAVGLHNLAEYLATVGSSGVTMLCYAQALALPEAAVVALTLLGGWQYRLIGQRHDPQRTFVNLSQAPALAAASRAR